MGCARDCDCGCCDGVAAVTPRAIYNRPGEDALLARVGEHGGFFATMTARLSSADFPALAGLGARTTDDPAIAMLDAWATVGDVLTFYQERLVNEGYLRTATERRSVLELANLIGYAPRPGVAATTYLAFQIDKNADEPVVIPTGSKVQSVPGPGEQPVTFETDHDVLALREWNAIRPRLEQPQSPDRIRFGTDDAPGSRIYLQGTATRLAAGDPLLIQFDGGVPDVVRITEVTADPLADRTRVRFTGWTGETLQAPAVTIVRRAVGVARQSPADAFAADSPKHAALSAIDAYLVRLYAQVTADPLDPDVAEVLDEERIIPAIVQTVLDVRQRIAAAEAAALAKVLPEGASRVGQLNSDWIEELTGLSGGGLIGRETDALAAQLAAINPNFTDLGTADMQASALLRTAIARLATERSVPPRNAETLARDPAALFDPRSDVGTQAVGALEPQIARGLKTAITTAQVAPAVPVRAFALRHRALLYGAGAPRKVTAINRDTGAVRTDEWTDADVIIEENGSRIDLDAPHDGIVPGDWVVLDYNAVDGAVLGRIVLPELTDDALLIGRVFAVQPKVARAGYGLTGQTSRIQLASPDGANSIAWFTFKTDAPNFAATASIPPPPGFNLIRNLGVMTQSEELALAAEPVDAEVCGGDDWIETDALYTGLDTGRWLVVSGERSDVPGTAGVQGSELAMLGAVRQDVQRTDDGTGFAPGETLHSFIRLAAPLSYCYRRGTVTINANVAKASHGDSRREVLGGGDATRSLQSFALKQPPLTYVAANEPDGIASTLKVYVNGVEWREAAAMVGLGPADRAFIVRTGDDGATSVTFGNGGRGARLPTGPANVAAAYRSGIGKGGNVQAGQLSQLLSRPFGVQAVANPIEATGGADRETRDQVRENAPLAVMALDRLVGPRDYADFARTFAGVAKAASARIFAGGATAMHVTIVGQDDIAVPPSSDLYRNLLAALRTYGDPALPVRLAERELLMLVLAVRVAPDPLYRWEDVVARVRAALLTRFGFDRQALGQGVALSEVIALIQAQRGVLYVDVDALGAVSQLGDDGARRSPQEIGAALREVIDSARERGRPAEQVPARGIRAATGGAVLPAQLALFVPSLPETLILNRIDAA